jgi:spore coat protein U-like protein
MDRSPPATFAKRTGRSWLSRTAIFVVAAWSAAAPVPNALAMNATVNLTLSLTLSDFCTVSAANVAFGTVNAGSAATNTSQRIALTCNKGVILSLVALNDGLNPAGTVKQMAAGAERLQYRIDVPTGPAFDACPTAGAGPEWNATNTIAPASLFSVGGGAKQIKICASVPAAQYPRAGAYFDTVAVTAAYN